MAVDDCNFDIGDLQDYNLDNPEKGSCGSGWLEFPKSQLCVPPDPIEDLEWFPSFPDDFISLNDVGLMQGQQSYCYAYAKPNQPLENLPFKDFPVTPDQQHEHEIKAKQQSKEANFIGFTRKKARTKNHQKPKCGAVTWVKKRCSHCKTEETPQWRAGPMGPKTLCNACGVRFKSGRLVPEYRPATSPTFDSTRHSNYHRMIMRRRSSNCNN